MKKIWKWNILVFLFHQSVKKPIIFLIYWTFSLHFLSGDSTGPAGSISEKWKVSVFVLRIIVLIPFFSFFLFPSQETNSPAESAVWVFGLILLELTWLGPFLQKCVAVQMRAMVKGSWSLWRFLPLNHSPLIVKGFSKGGQKIQKCFV